MITITDSARDRIIQVLTEENATILRFGLAGGGCSGFQYFLAVDESKNEDDTEYQLNDTMAVVVDSMSSMYLAGATIDFRKGIMGESFVFDNPNATSHCGCGSSVSF